MLAQAGWMRVTDGKRTLLTRMAELALEAPSDVEHELQSKYWLVVSAYA